LDLTRARVGTTLQHACVRDASDPAKTDHLTKLSAIGDPSLTMSRSAEPGVVKIFEADLTVAGSYDDAMAGCSCVVHVGTPMGYAGNNNPREIFDGAVEGTMNIIETIKRTGSVKRLICKRPPVPSRELDFPRGRCHQFADRRCFDSLLDNPGYRGAAQTPRPSPPWATRRLLAVSAVQPNLAATLNNSPNSLPVPTTSTSLVRFPYLLLTVVCTLQTSTRRRTGLRMVARAIRCGTLMRTASCHDRTKKTGRLLARSQTFPVSKAQHSTAQHSAAQHSTAQRSTAQHSTAQHSAAQHSTAQHSTAQRSTAQHSTAQHSTA
jgi:hypothetical protein